MKKYLIAVGMCGAMAIPVLAQTTDAGIAFNNFKRDMKDPALAYSHLEKAKQYIDKAMLSEADKAKPKTWYYAGDIYTSLVMFNKLSTGEMLINAFMQMASDPENVPKAKAKEIVNALLDNTDFDKGLDYYNQHITMPKKAKDDYTEEIKAGLGQGIMIFLTLANSALQEGEYELAAKAYTRTYRIMQIIGKVDYSIPFNAAVAYENGKNWEKASELYKVCMEQNFEGPASTGRYAKSLYNLGKKDEAWKVLEEGRKTHGSHKDFASEEANLYIASGQIEKAEAALIALINSDPKNPLLHFNVGVVYDNSGQTDKAAAAYNKAIDLDPSYFDALFNLGAMHYNKGVEFIKSANNRNIDDAAGYEKDRKAADDQFKAAVPHLENARSIAPADKQNLRILMTIYGELKMDAKRKEINDELNK